MPTRRRPTTTAARPATNAPPPLLTSPITGEICCEQHAPRRRTDSWWRDRWRRVTPRDRTEWPTAELGEMRCEVCKAIERRASDAAADADASRTAGA